VRPKLPLIGVLALLAVLATASKAGAIVGLSNNHIAPAQRNHPAAQAGTNRGGLIAPDDLCQGQDEPTAPTGVQRRAMLCMVDFARRSVGLRGLSESHELDRSADAKSDDILRCDSFSHEACGREFTFWIKDFGYIPASCWRVGENLAWGSGPETSVRAIFTNLIHSPEHRENILGHYSQIGLGLQVGDLDGHDKTHVWTQHFGTHC
jgi:uncharacterized protein YkwD